MCVASQITFLYILPLTDLSEYCFGAMSYHIRMLLKYPLKCAWCDDVLVLLATSLRRAGCLRIKKTDVSSLAFGMQALWEWTFPCIGHKCIPCFEAPSFARWAPGGTSHRWKRCHEPCPPYLWTWPGNPFHSRKYLEFDGILSTESTVCIHCYFGVYMAAWFNAT